MARKRFIDLEAGATFIHMGAVYRHNGFRTTKSEIMGGRATSVGCISDDGKLTLFAATHEAAFNPYADVDEVELVVVPKLVNPEEATP